MSPVGFPTDMSSFYEPRWAGTRELRLADRWLARWVDDGPLPPNAPISYVYALVMMDGKGYVARQSGDSVWASIEGEPVEIENGDQALKRMLKEQMNAVAGQVEVAGYLECKATSFHPDLPAGSASVQPLYAVVAKSVGNMPANGTYERRRLPLNEYITALRASYPQFEEQIGHALDRYIVALAREGNAPAR